MAPVTRWEELSYAPKSMTQVTKSLCEMAAAARVFRGFSEARYHSARCRFGRAVSTRALRDAIVPQDALGAAACAAAAQVRSLQPRW
jgi:hypothetical protein